MCCLRSKEGDAELAALSKEKCSCPRQKRQHRRRCQRRVSDASLTKDARVRRLYSASRQIRTPWKDLVSDSSRLGSNFEFAKAVRKVGLARRGAIVFSAAMLSLGCADEDRVLTAHCQIAIDGFATATFFPWDAPDATIGGLNARQDALGTLFRFVPDQGKIGGARWLRAYTVIAKAMSVSHAVYWNSLSIHARLNTDLDGEALAESSRASVESALLSGSHLIAWDVERQAIKDVLQVVNEDPEAMRILKGASAEDRYLVISSRLLAKYTGIVYSPGGGIWLSNGQGSASTPFVSVWTFRIENTNFHSNYLCGPADELNSKATSMNARVPAIYFYTAVRYDSATGKVERDRRASDLDLLTATMRAAQARR